MNEIGSVFLQQGLSCGFDVFNHGAMKLINCVFSAETKGQLKTMLLKILCPRLNTVAADDSEKFVNKTCFQYQGYV